MNTTPEPVKVENGWCPVRDLPCVGPVCVFYCTYASYVVRAPLCVSPYHPRANWSPDVVS